MLLLILAAFWTLPLGILLALMIAERFGARAAVWLLFPFPILVAHSHAYVAGGMEGLVESATFSMTTVPMALSWAFAYTLASRWIAPRVASRPVQAALSMLLATAMSAGFIALSATPWEWLCAEPERLIPSTTAVLVLAALALRLPEEEREPLRPSFGLAGLISSAFTVLVVLVLLGFTSGKSGLAGLAFLFLSSFPRMTFEVAVAHHIALGPVGARQAVSSLPIPVAVICTWCFVFIGLGGRLPDPVVGGLAIGAAIALWLAGVATYARWWPHHIWRLERAHELAPDRALTPVPVPRG